GDAGPPSGGQPHASARSRADLVICDTPGESPLGHRDQFGFALPPGPVGLRVGGPRFLTDAFRASGVLDGDNSVTRITEFHEVAGGSTGRKVALAVEYGKAAVGLHTDLFVKFSRDLDNPIRDRGKAQIEPEVRF